MRGEETRGTERRKSNFVFFFFREYSIIIKIKYIIIRNLLTATFLVDFFDLKLPRNFMNYDRLHGNSLDCCLDTLENDPLVKYTYAIDARNFWGERR